MLTISQLSRIIEEAPTRGEIFFGGRRRVKGEGGCHPCHHRLLLSSSFVVMAVNVIPRQNAREKRVKVFTGKEIGRQNTIWWRAKVNMAESTKQGEEAVVERSCNHMSIL